MDSSEAVKTLTGTEPPPSKTCLADVNQPNGKKQCNVYMTLIKNGKFDATPPTFETLTWMKLFTCKWVFHKKSNSNGPPCYNARMAVLRFEQTHGINFDEKYAPVSKSTTFWLLLAKATMYRWSLTHMDMEMVFLNPKIDRDNIYIILQGHWMFFESNDRWNDMLWMEEIDCWVYQIYRTDRPLG